MRESESRPRGRRLALLAIVAAALLVAASGTLAAVPSPKVRGTVGEWSLAESPDCPAVRCMYDHIAARSVYKLVALEILPPRVLWPDRRPDRSDERGRVSWQVRIQQLVPDGTGWRALASAPLQWARARESLPAVFVQEGLDWPVRGEMLLRFQQRIRWYRRDGSVLGSVRAWSQWTRQEGDLHAVLPGECPNRVHG